MRAAYAKVRQLGQEEPNRRVHEPVAADARLGDLLVELQLLDDRVDFLERLDRDVAVVGEDLPRVVEVVEVHEQRHQDREPVRGQPGVPDGPVPEVLRPVHLALDLAHQPVEALHPVDLELVAAQEQVLDDLRPRVLRVADQQLVDEARGVARNAQVLQTEHPEQLLLVEVGLQLVADVRRYAAETAELLFEVQQARVELFERF